MREGGEKEGMEEKKGGEGEDPQVLVDTPMFQILKIPCSRAAALYCLGSGS